MHPVPSRRGPPKGYRRGNADPQSLHPKLLKIRESVHALQHAYGERLVLNELHKALFGDGPCEIGVDYEGMDDSSQTSTGPSIAAASTSKRGAGSSASDASGHALVRSRSDWSQEENDGVSRSPGFFILPLAAYKKN